ncbi:ABC transporter permease [Pseudothermotoga sp. U03pept]|uniref:ABC transporter permease n=1 Tax=Pseudothermotoga sp. U03pept TaxID=3447012 RepID=UPI003F09A33F
MFWNLLKKELKEVLTVSSVVTVVVISFVYAFIGKSVGNIEKEVLKKPSVAIVNLDEGDFGKAVEQGVVNFANVFYNGNDLQKGLEELKRQNGTALLVIEKDFTKQLQSGEKARIKVFWLLKGLGIADTISSSVFEGFYRTFEDQIKKAIMVQHGIQNPQFVLSPIEKTDTTVFGQMTLEDMSPPQLLNLTNSQTTMTSVVIMMLIIMAGNTVISSMGLEKENKTLETLMTLPVKRSYIVFSKILAATIAGSVMAGIYMIGFNFYMKSFTFSSTASLGLRLDLSDYLLVGVSLFSALLCGIGMAMLLGVISKDFKSAQVMTFPITALAIFSMIVTMFKDFATLSLPLRVVIFAIPFTHPMLSMRNLLFGNNMLVVCGCFYNIVLAVFLITLITRIFNSDRLIVGVSFKNSRKKENTKVQ